MLHSRVFKYVCFAVIGTAINACTMDNINHYGDVCPNWQYVQTENGVCSRTNLSDCSEEFRAAANANHCPEKYNKCTFDDKDQVFCMSLCSDKNAPKLCNGKCVSESMYEAADREMQDKVEYCTLKCPADCPTSCNAQGECETTTCLDSCVNGCNADGSCKCSDKCQSGCYDDGSCKCSEACANECNADGSCKCSETCANGCNADGSCKCDISCPNGCDATGTLCCSENCQNGCNSSGGCLCPKGCANGCDVSGNACCSLACKNGCELDETCSCPGNCVNGCNENGTCKASEGCLNGIDENGACKCPNECQNGCDEKGETCKCSSFCVGDATNQVPNAPVKRAVSQVHHVMKTPANAHALKHANLAVMQLVTATKHVQISNVKASTNNAKKANAWIFARIFPAKIPMNIAGWANVFPLMVIRTTCMTNMKQQSIRAKNAASILIATVNQVKAMVSVTAILDINVQQNAPRTNNV